MFFGGADNDDCSGMFLLGLLVGALVVIAWNCYSREGLVAVNRMGINTPNPSALGAAIQARDYRDTAFVANAQPITPSTFRDGMASYTPHDYDASVWKRATHAGAPARWIDWRTSDQRDDEFDKYLRTTNDPFNYGSIEGFNTEANPWSGPEVVAKYEGYADARGTSASYSKPSKTPKELVQDRMKKIMNTCPENKSKTMAQSSSASAMGM